MHVEELGEIDGSWFLAMEYLHGDALSALLAALEHCPLIAPLRASPALAEPAQRVRARAAEVRRAWDAW